MTNEERTALAGEYVLGTLTASEREAVERALPDDPALAAEVRLWEERLSGLAVATPDTAPPDAVWQRIAAGLPASGSRTAGAAAVADSAAIIELRRKVGIWRTATVIFAALAAVIAVVFFISPVTTGNAPAERYLAFVNAEGGPPPVVVDFDPATGIVTAQSLGATAPADRSLELWYIGAGRDPLSLGVLDAVGTRIVVASAEIEDFAPDGAVFAVTEELRGGSPTGAPTGPVVLQGDLVRGTF